MSVDIAAILIGILAIIASVIAGIYAATSIANDILGEYVAQITARLIAVERKLDTLIQNQNHTTLTSTPPEIQPSYKLLGGDSPDQSSLTISETSDEH
jgi:hypothetical protein